ncbi:hypothetical protein ABMA28_004698 [Loxostege sticticalis]|uniref:Gag polyprotein n=1 Tax=Loxostege sticticalis TaxID=481309 RepID=A0ABD0SWG2_LOXSC
MDHPIKFLSLQKSELEYEVGLRGDTPADNVAGLRKQITKSSRGFTSEDILESHLDPSDDLKGARECLVKSQSAIAGLKTTYEKNLYLRTENLLNHIYHRLTRITPKSPEDTSLLSELNKHLNIQLKDIKNLAPVKTTALSEEDVRDNKDSNTATNIAVTCDRGISSDLFKLKFDGKTCVRSFIEKVEEFIKARNISSDKVLSFAAEIFTENALHWFRSIRDTVNSWEELFDYDYRLMSEIRARSQGECENITIYLSIMHCMFSRLSRTLPEDEKLEILLHNIRPCYANTLANAPEIKTIDALRSQCRNFENYQSRLSQFREPPRVTAETLAPEFAYNKPSTSKTYNNNNNNHMYKPNNYMKQNDYPKTNNNTNYTNAIEALPVHPIAKSDGGVRLPFCPRCRTHTHSLKYCKEPKFLICFKCGKKDVTYPTCPDCVKPPNYPNHRTPKN